MNFTCSSACGELDARVVVVGQQVDKLKSEIGTSVRIWGHTEPEQDCLVPFSAEKGAGKMNC